MKICVLCFDLSDNALGRAALLAWALARRHEVELVGPLRGKEIWFPLKDLDLPIKRFPWKRYPAFGPVIRRMVKALDADVLVASKLRPTSFGVGWIKKKISGTPLVVDIDDWELGFYYQAGFWGRVGRFLNVSNPNGLPYTWLMERLVGQADAITVSNRFLQNRFSGSLLYHCRDTSVLDPARFDREEIRARLGLQGKKVLMFLGTPRAHKGIEDLFAALSRIRDPRVHLAIVGAGGSLEQIDRRWPELKDRVSLFEEIPFDQLGETLSAADVVVIPQRHTSGTVGQMPAKIFDAMSMAKPIVSTRVSDIPEVLGDCGYLVDPGDVQQLADQVTHVLTHPEEAMSKAQKARERCRNLFDITLLEKGLHEVVERAAHGARADLP